MAGADEIWPVAIVLCYRLIVAEYRCKDLCVAQKVGVWFPCNTPLRSGTRM